MACLLFHKWNGCKCSKCGAIRDKKHDWNGCTCKRCYKTRQGYELHDIDDNCTCKICGKTDMHSWYERKCKRCGIPSECPYFCDRGKCNATPNEINNCPPYSVEKHTLGAYRECPVFKYVTTGDIRHVL